MSEVPAIEEAFLAEVERIAARRPDLGPLAHGMLAAAVLDIASDSRSFARVFALEHALVVREVHTLVGAGLLALLDRDVRTQRCRYAVLSNANEPIARNLLAPS